MQDLRFPIGEFTAPATITPGCRNNWIKEIGEAPAQLRAAVAGLEGEQLEIPYRPDGWTVRQVVHHLPDSHLNSYQRFKLALTEEEPTIRPYDEAAWGELADARQAPLELSLDIMEALHQRWVFLFSKMNGVQWKRRFRHPERGDVTSLEWNLGLYAWHGNHHIAHITSLRQRMGW